MTNPRAVTEASLLFNWERPEGEKFLIACCLVASVILHAFCFYLFQITYPPAVSLLAPPAHVKLIATNSEEGRTVLRWVDAEDPALASATMRPPDARWRALPTLQHIPSYLTEESKLKKAPPLNLAPVRPSSHPPGPVTPPRQKVVPQPSPIPTHVLFSEELGNLGAASSPAPKFTASTKEMPQNIRFRIGVGSGGDIRYCFRLNSSGDSALDEQARRYLVLCRFPQKSSPEIGPAQALAWGVATVEWGNDIAQPPSPSPASP